MIFRNRIVIRNTLLLLLCGFTLYAQQTRYELKKVRFTGNSYFNSSQLAEVCLIKESPGWFSKFLNSFTPFGSSPVYFDSLMVPVDVGLIKDTYHSMGFWNVRVTSKYVTNKNEKSAELEFIITENEPFRFRKFDVTGLERLPVDLQRYLQNEIVVDTTEQYSTALVNSKKDFIRSFLNNNGFMDASDPKPDVGIDTLRNKVDVKINFDTKGRFKISEIRVEKTGPGKDLINENLIKEIFGIKPDTFYNQFENTKAQLRLWRTDLFDSLALNRGFVDEANNLVPLEIIGKITSMNELSPEVIGNNEEDELNLGVALSFIKKNFLGDARKMTITATAATKNFDQIAYTDLRVGFEQPYLFGSQIRPRFETYFTNQLWKNKFNAIFYGTKLNLDFESELTPYTFFTSFSTYINWEYSKYKYEKPYLLDRLKAGGLNIEVGDSPTFSGDNAVIGLVFGRNKTNRASFPTEGYFASLVVEDGNSFLYLLNRIFSSQFSRPLYLKTIFSLSDFLPLWDPQTSVLGIKLKAGSILTYRGDKVDIPINQRFYAGGSNSVRGWKSRDLVPITTKKEIGQQITNEDLEALLKNAFPGGYLLFEGSFEFRAKLNEFIASAVFLDYGNTWNQFKDISIQSFAVSTGFGIRFYSGFVPPIRFDFGFKLYDPFKRKMDLNKTIGDLFSENLEIQFGIGEAF